jgi:hypothetical protein
MVKNYQDLYDSLLPAYRKPAIASTRG